MKHRKRCANNDWCAKSENKEVHKRKGWCPITSTSAWNFESFTNLTIFVPNTMWRIIDRKIAAPSHTSIEILVDEQGDTINQCKNDGNSMEKWLDLGTNISV
mmetsp:Transcript_2541/g.3922  ORF Transcript_2541/g.3922 Transcript_2541/m.3922 type:complete len:102 (-) Transcript_2541:187-492(-)